MPSRLIGFFAAALWASSASAVSLNPRGVGQVLLFPYYTVNQHDTLLTITNDSDLGKAVKLRFRESLNGRAALECFVFLAAHDSWVAGVGADSAGGGARISTSDHSCTLQLTSGQAFSTAAFSGDLADGGPTDASRTREGFIEVIAAGDVKRGSPTETAITTAPGTASPPACGSLSLAAVAHDLEAPTATLGGSAVIIDVGQGTFYGYVPDAIEGMTAVPLLTPNNTAAAPSLDQANSADVRQGARAHLVLENGRPLDVDYARGIDAISAVLMKQSLANDYLVDSTLGAATDWVVTFPTRAFYVDQALYPDAPRAPFAHAADATDAPELFAFVAYDREGQFTSLVGCPSAGGAHCYPARTFAHAVNVLDFNFSDQVHERSRVLDSAYPVDGGRPLLAASGWARVDFAEGAAAATQHLDGGRSGNVQVQLPGLPAIGFMVYNIINTQAAPGLLANYGGAFPHRSAIACVATNAVSCN